MNSSPEGPLLFVRSFLSDPLRIGALAPSSPYLSRLMASSVNSSNLPVLEIGAGTGVITRELLQQGVCTKRLLVVERDPSLADFLREQFPGTLVRCGDALHAKRLLAAEGLPLAGSILSSLPLRNLSRPDQLKIVQAMLAALSPNGQLIQFTYAAGCPIPCRTLGLQAQCLGRVWRNLPPAAVWRFTFEHTDKYPRKNL